MTLQRTTFRIDYDSDNKQQCMDIESIRKLIRACGFTTSHRKGVMTTGLMDGRKAE